MFMPIMGVPVVMRMTLCMIMTAAAPLLGEVIRPALQDHHGVSPGDTAALVPFKTEFPTLQAKFAQLCTKGIGVNPQVYQGPQGHIAGDTGEAVKV
jgi:hypothetical protein